MTETEILNWLGTRPREQATLLAARGALRAIPSYAVMLRVNDVLIPVLRSAALAWCSTLDPSRSSEFSSRIAAAHEAANRAAQIARADALEAEAILRREESADYPVTSARTGSALDAAHEAMSAASRKIVSGRTITSADSESFAAISGDIQLFNDSESIATIASTSLWSTPRPDWVAEHWRLLKEHLLALDLNWRAWTNWYDARLNGEAINLDKEIARALEVTDADWAGGISSVNAKLLAIEERFQPKSAPQNPEQPIALPAQSKPAPQFRTQSDGRIDVETAIDVSATSQELRKHALIKARKLVRRLPEQSNDDRAEIRALAANIDLLLTANTDGGETSAVAIWSYSLSLKSKLNADRRRQRLTEHERERQDEPVLPIGVSEELQDLVATLDRLSKDDRELRRTEEYEPTIEEIASAKAALETARPLVISALSEDELITAKAAEILRPVASETPIEEQGKRDVISTKTVENFLIQAVREAAVAANAATTQRDTTPDARDDFELIRTAVATLTLAVDQNTRAQRDAKRSEFTVAMTAGAAGNVIAAGTLAVVNQGNIALAWVLANAELIARFASVSTTLAAVGLIALAIGRLFSAPLRR